MTEQNAKTEPAAAGPRRRYRQWEKSTPEEAALSRKVFFVMMGVMGVLLVVLAYGALK